jgi:hypothetical protein
MSNENIAIQHHQYTGGTVHQNDTSLPTAASLPPGEGESHSDHSTHGHGRHAATVADEQQSVLDGSDEQHNVPNGLHAPPPK